MIKSYIFAGAPLTPLANNTVAGARLLATLLSVRTDLDECDQHNQEKVIINITCASQNFARTVMGSSPTVSMHLTSRLRTFDQHHSIWRHILISKHHREPNTISYFNCTHPCPACSLVQGTLAPGPTWPLKVLARVAVVKIVVKLSCLI